MRDLRTRKFVSSETTDEQLSEAEHRNGVDENPALARYSFNHNDDMIRGLP